MANRVHRSRGLRWWRIADADHPRMRFDSEPRLQALAATQDGLITAHQAMTLGYTRAIITSRRKTGRWRVLAPGVYLIEAQQFVGEITPRMWWRAALLFHGTNSCLVTTSALRAYGVAGLPMKERRVEVGVIGGPSRHGRSPSIITVRGKDDEAPDVVVRQFEIAPSEIVTHDGLQTRGLAASLVDTALEIDRPTALALLDSALHKELLTMDELHHCVLLAAGRRGVVRLRELAALADGRAASPLESRVRLACIDGKVAPDELQYPVRDEHGHLLAVGDLAWVCGRRRPLIAEADGAVVHALPEAVYRDRWRGNLLVAQACDTVRFTYADTMRPGYIASVIKSALAA